MVGAKWDDATSKWKISIQRPKGSSSDGVASESEVFEDTADLLFTGIGSLSRWNWPDIDGLRTFKGNLIHSAQWEVAGQDDLAFGNAPVAPQIRKGWEEDVKDWGSKRVAVIGVVSYLFGSSVPALVLIIATGLFGYTDCSCLATKSCESLELRPWQDLDGITIRRWEDG